MGITYGDYLIDSGYYDITPEQEREIEAREECKRRGLDPDDDACDGAVVWMVVGQEMQQRRSHPPEPLSCPICSANGWTDPDSCDHSKTERAAHPPSPQDTKND